MAKKTGKGSGFKNSLAEFLKDANRVILYDEERIYREMNREEDRATGKTAFDVVLDQMNKNLKGYEVQDNRNPKKKFTKKDKEPRYFLNAFHNVSFLKYIMEWLEENKGEISHADKNSISVYMAMGFKDSRLYPQADQELRDEMMLDIFYILQKKRVKMVREIVRRKSKAIEIAMYTMLQPLYTARNVINLLDKHSPAKEKRKIKMLQKLYGKKRFPEFMGYCMTNDFKDNSLLIKLIKWGLKQKKSTVRKYLREYARAYKKIIRYNTLVADFGKKKKNKKLMKELVKDDLGFKKAFTFGKKRKQKEVEDLRFVPDLPDSVERKYSEHKRPERNYDDRKYDGRDRHHDNKPWQNRRR